MADCDDFWEEICIEDSNYCYAVNLPVFNKLYKANFLISVLVCAKKTGHYENINVNADKITVSVDDGKYKQNEYRVVIDNAQDVLPKSHIAFHDDFFALLDVMSIILYRWKQSLNTWDSCVLTTDTGTEIALSIYDYMQFLGININAANLSTTKKIITKNLKLLAALNITDKRSGQYLPDLHNARIIDGFSYAKHIFHVKLSSDMVDYIKSCKVNYKYPIILPLIAHQRRAQYAYIIGRKLALDGTRPGSNGSISMSALLSICPTLRRQIPGSSEARDVARYVYGPITRALQVLMDCDILIHWDRIFERGSLSDDKLKQILKGKRYSDFLNILISYDLSGVPNPYSIAPRTKAEAEKNKTAPDTAAEPSDDLKKMLDEFM